MLLPRLQLLLLAANGVLAFKDTSPFLLVSSDPLSKDAPLQSAQVALAQDVEDRLIDTLSACDKEAYFVVSQEHVRAGDLRQGAMPQLQNVVAGSGEANVVQIPEVVGMKQLSSETLVSRLEDACSAKGKKRVDSSPVGVNEYTIVVTTLPALPSSEDAKARVLKDADHAIENIIASPDGNLKSSVFIYITTPPAREGREAEDSLLYEMDDPYPSALHTDLKRNMAGHKRQEDGNYSMQDGLPLFEKYQFLSPALFMTLGVSVLLLFILYVGISAISGLEVSYAAFSKEMGPQAQKGNKQS